MNFNNGFSPSENQGILRARLPTEKTIRNGENPTSQSPTVLSAPESLNKEKRGAGKESAIRTLGSDIMGEPELLFLEGFCNPLPNFVNNKKGKRYYYPESNYAI